MRSILSLNPATARVAGTHPLTTLGPGRTESSTLEGIVGAGLKVGIGGVFGLGQLASDLFGDKLGPQEDQYRGSLGSQVSRAKVLVEPFTPRGVPGYKEQVDTDPFSGRILSYGKPIGPQNRTPYPAARVQATTPTSQVSQVPRRSKRTTINRPTRRTGRYAI